MKWLIENNLKPMPKITSSRNILKKDHKYNLSTYISISSFCYLINMMPLCYKIDLNA